MWKDDIQTKVNTPYFFQVKFTLVACDKIVSQLLYGLGAGFYFVP
jgi:hypothetical protein